MPILLTATMNNPAARKGVFDHRLHAPNSKCGKAIRRGTTVP
jgi:hypothetical protein